MPKLLVAAGAVALILTMTGCGDPPPPVTPTPTSSAAPVFASDEEALAAAEESYRAYTEVADQIFHEGGADPDRLTAVATGDFLDASIAGFENVREKGWHSIGHSTFDSLELQRIDSSPSGIVSAYLCGDVSGVEVVDSDGVSVVAADRPDRTYFEVIFDLDVATGRLLVASRQVWGDGKC
jgi:hypothetical protein